MRLTFILLMMSSLFFMGCEHNRKKNFVEGQNTSSIDKLEPEVQSDSNRIANSTKKPEKLEQRKINLDSILTDEFNGYLATNHNDSLSMCCYKTIDITPWINYSEFKLSIEIYTPFNNKEIVQTVDVYQSDSSYIKIYTYRHEDLVQKNIVCGKINTSNLLKHPTIKIGMSRNSFLNIYFLKSEKFDDINCLLVYENEMGEGWTKYEFDQGVLSKISFDSVNEWVKRL